MLIAGKALLSQVAQATRSLELISPLVGGVQIEDVLSRSPAKRKRLLTRYRPGDILSGLTDLALLARLRRTVEIRFLEDVHARLYIVDARWAYVGSALLTPAGLCESPIDVGVQLTGDPELRSVYAQFAQLWTQAVELTPAQWTLALHASDHAMDLMDRVRGDVSAAERALQRFVEVPRLRPTKKPAVVLPMRHTPDFVRRRMESWAGPAAHALAAFLAWTIEQIPGAADSEAWTVLLGEHHVRLKLGLPEIFTVEEGEHGGVLSVMGLASQLSEDQRAQIRRVGGSIAPSPYASATGLSREALRIGNLPLRELHALRPVLEPGLSAYVQLHWSQAPTLAQRAFAPSVLEYLEDELDRSVPWPRHRAKPTPETVSA